MISADHRRTTGSYSFGYCEMNEILRKAHLDKKHRDEEHLAERDYNERLEVVCDSLDFMNMSQLLGTNIRSEKQTAQRLLLGQSGFMIASECVQPHKNPWHYLLV